MTSYTAYIDSLNRQSSPPLVLSGLHLAEQYNLGWSGVAVMSTNRDNNISIGEAVLLGFGLGIAPDQPVSVYVALSGAAPKRRTTEAATPAATSESGEDTPEAEGGAEGPEASEEIEGREDAPEPQPGDVLRAWPAIVAQLTSSPPPNDSSGTLLNITLVDPITYLSGRPIWGAYRACSAAEMIGGAMSLAVGGDGKPTLNPIMPNMPLVRIVNNLRSDLDRLPYSIAAGDTLGAWLYQIQSLLGIRAEMRANPDNSIELILTDQRPAGTPLELSTIVRAPDEDQSTGRPGVTRNNYLYISKIVASDAPRARGIVFDDPEFGGYHRFGDHGSVGELINTAGLTVDEVATRVQLSLSGTYSDALALQAISWEPLAQPGKLIQLDQTILGVDLWQTRSVEHNIDGSAYTNRMHISRGDISWHPSLPAPTPPLYATGIVDGGFEFIKSERVPRDQLGRIPVTLSFLPTPVGEEELLLSKADVNQDNRLTLDDYTQDEIDDYERNPEEWAAKERAFLNGEDNDPYPNRPDNDLTEKELDERLTAESNQDAALKYIAYKRAKRLDTADRDKDGYVSTRDDVISEELSAVLSRPNGREQVVAQLNLHKKGKLDEEVTQATRNLRIPVELLEEYDALFLAPQALGPQPTEVEEGSEWAAPHAVERRDAQLSQEKWPPRIPLTSAEPMAGALHSFIPGHNHGDICRIAVHNPLFAELIGFQYRSNRQINSHIVSATAGMVVEHNYSDSWSGMVFRPADNFEDSFDEEAFLQALENREPIPEGFAPESANDEQAGRPTDGNPAAEDSTD